MAPIGFNLQANPQVKTLSTSLCHFLNCPLNHYQVTNTLYRSLLSTIPATMLTILSILSRERA